MRQRLPESQPKEKNMKLMKLLFAVTCLLGLVASSFAQNVETRKKTLGYLDPKTGLFHSLARTPLSAEEAGSITPTTGTFAFTVTITISKTLPTTAVIECEVFGGVEDSITGTFSNEEVVTATRSGTTATCKLTMPYSWDLGNSSKDVVNLDLIVSASYTTPQFYEESFDNPLITIPVPANGSTTKENITTTI
jgi:hypothetical protein